MISRTSAGRVDAAARQQPGDDVREGRVHEVAHRHVDRDRQVRPRPARPHAAQRPLQHPGRERVDQAGVLGERDEHVRRHAARGSGAASAPAPRSRPARPVADVALGLEVQHAAGRRCSAVAQLAEQRQPVGAVGVAVRRCRSATCPLALLRRVHRDVGALQQLAGARRRGPGARRCRCWPRRRPTARRARRAREHLRQARPAVIDAPSSPSVPGSRTANSSPPRRASVSASRRQPASRSATWRSRRSPLWWPRVSLTSLKRSRSSSRTAVRRRRAGRAASARSVAVEQQRAVRQPGQRVVQRLVLVAGRLAHAAGATPGRRAGTARATAGPARASSDDDDAPRRPRRPRPARRRRARTARRRRSRRRRGRRAAGRTPPAAAPSPSSRDVRRRWPANSLSTSSGQRRPERLAVVARAERTARRRRRRACRRRP